jgi:ABC-type nitrate/sulfonate/bicarbonate transport system permease component
LRQITDRATAIRHLLQTRQQRLFDVEQQILALKSQLQQAEARASQLVQELPLSADVTSQAVMLGLLAAVLLIAPAATAIGALRWNRELQTPVLMMAVQSRRR